MANRLAQVVSSVVSIEQSAFIKGRQILDGPMMLNEIVGWSKARKRELLVFKVDFEKAYDSLSWDYLFEVMGLMGFGHKWSSWIRALLMSVIKAMQRAREANVFRGIQIGGDGAEVSHFFYADDAVFLCDWSLENAKRILRILRCFFSGLLSQNQLTQK